MTINSTTSLRWRGTIIAGATLASSSLVSCADHETTQYSVDPSDSSSTGANSDPSLTSNSDDLDAELVQQLGSNKQAFGYGFWWGQSTSPRIQCVESHGNGNYTAHWGYDNPRDQAIDIPIGYRNRFLFGPQDLGQPTHFEPGLHDNEFTTDISFGFGGRLWMLGGRMTWLSWFTPECEINPCEGADDGAACEGDEGSGICLAEQCEQCSEDSHCDDGLFCNGNESCNAGTCEEGSAPSCEDDQFCNGSEVCDEDIDACIGSPAVQCDDGLFCNGSESCNEDIDACVAGETVLCGDANACNGVEACNEALDSCEAGAVLNCDDSSSCTTDSCDPTLGCVNGDVSPTCEIGSECLVGSCDASGGCVSDPVDDGMACGDGFGECEAGACACADGSLPTEVVLDHSFRAAYNSPDGITYAGLPAWKVGSYSYQVRVLNFDNAVPGLGFEAVTRPYFTFDLAGVSGQVIGAELMVAHAGTSYDSTDSAEGVTLHQVTTSSSVLEAVAANSSGTDLAVLDGIFTDLGTGPEYGRFQGTLSDNSTTENISLNANALGDINASGGLWSLGADLFTAGGAPRFGTERVWRGSGTGAPATQLVLTVCGANPPASGADAGVDSDPGTGPDAGTP